jgi:hypothetical protein
MTTEQQQNQRDQEQTQGDEGEQPQEDRELFDDSELQSFRARWEQVQGEFVDEPRESVQKADDLVSDLVQRLASGFAETRSGLEEQWNKGEDASTEDLRVALTRYRAFFQRLLKV